MNKRDRGTDPLAEWQQRLTSEHVRPLYDYVIYRDEYVFRMDI